MNLDKIIARCRKLSRPYRITEGKGFRLSDYDPDDTGDLRAADKPRAGDALKVGVEALADLQERLYAQNQWAMLLIFQAMDGAGKDSAIKHVMSGVNPQGCQVHSFKAPSSDDLDHDYLWRCMRQLPERGRIGIFNRSYYEEVLVVRVHPELLRRQQLPRPLVGRGIWPQRFEEIRNFERYLFQNGVIVLKFFLNLSRSEQRKRFLARLEEPEKNWKFSLSDMHERRFWRDYQRSYEDAIRHTATKEAPWHVVPADHKWYTRIVVAATIVEAMHSLDLRFPESNPEHEKELKQARKELQKEAKGK